jgi:hypothetical protein
MAKTTPSMKQRVEAGILELRTRSARHNGGDQTKSDTYYEAANVMETALRGPRRVRKHVKSENGKVG